MLLPLALFLAQPALAADLPLRPLTYNLDPKLSQGAIANFRELYVDPDAFVKSVQPATPPKAAPVTPPPVEQAPTADGAAPPAPAVTATAVNVPPTGMLLVTNDRGSWATVTINGTKVGKVGPQIVGVLSLVASGTYTVALTWANGLTQTYDVDTTYGSAPGAFGGPPSALARPDGALTTKVPQK